MTFTQMLDDIRQWLLTCLLAVGFQFMAVSATVAAEPKPMCSMLIVGEGASQNFKQAIKKQIGKIVTTGRPGDRILLLRAPGHELVARLAISSAVGRQRLRNPLLAAELRKVAEFCDQKSSGSQDRQGQLGVPSLSATYWSLVSDKEFSRVRIILCGDPVYHDPKQPFWSMRQRRWPSDKALTEPASGLPFVNRAYKKMPADTQITFLTPDPEWSTKRHRDQIMRFYRLAFQTQLGGTLAGDSSSVESAFRQDQEGGFKGLVEADGHDLVGVWQLSTGATYEERPTPHEIPGLEMVSGGAVSPVPGNRAAGSGSGAGATGGAVNPKVEVKRTPQQSEPVGHSSAPGRSSGTPTAPKTITPATTTQPTPTSQKTPPSHPAELPKTRPTPALPIPVTDDENSTGKGAPGSNPAGTGITTTSRTDRAPVPAPMRLPPGDHRPTQADKPMSERPAVRGNGLARSKIPALPVHLQEGASQASESTTDDRTELIVTWESECPHVDINLEVRGRNNEVLSCASPVSAFGRLTPSLPRGSQRRYPAKQPQEVSESATLRGSPGDFEVSLNCYETHRHVRGRLIIIRAGGDWREVPFEFTRGDQGRERNGRASSAAWKQISLTANH